MAVGSLSVSARTARGEQQAASCRLKACGEPRVAYGYCDEHLRERQPAVWAKRHRLVGREQPRLATEPRRKLTRKTTLGFEAITFAEEMLGMELLPWQRWWLLHALELDPGGGFRFRTVLTLVARQNGKTTLLKALALYFMYLGRARLVLGAAQSLDIARESWAGAVELAEGDPELRAEIDMVRRANGEQELRLVNGARYRITAATRSAGRGLSVDLLILDELREHQTWAAWGALSKTTIARPNALTIGISNAGDDQSLVLNSLRESALAGTDPSIALFEWSAPDGCELDDRDGWAQANPGVGWTISEQAIATAMATDPPAVFRTEVLCQRVDVLDTAIDRGGWLAGHDPTGTLDGLRDRVALCVDVAPDGQHATLVAAAALDDGRVRVEPVAAWDSTDAARDELEEWLQRIGPAGVAWFPSGPAGALAPVLRPRKQVDNGLGGAADELPWHYVELTGGKVAEACMGLADLVIARRVLHPGDPLLDAHVAGAQKLEQGDGWRFVRRGAGHVDAAYAAAGAVYVALTLPIEKPLPRPMVV